MKEVIWHGLGGQGAVAASSVLGTAVGIYEGKYALSIPIFGAQRRGGAVLAITRISESPIRNRAKECNPDLIVIIDESLISPALSGLNETKPCQIIVNSKKSAKELGLEKLPNVVMVDADSIASGVPGRPMVNSVLVGIVAAVTGLVALDSIKKAITEVVPSRHVESNIAAAEAGFKAIKKR